MSLIANVQKIIASISDKAHRKFNTTKLDLKIKAYSKEINELFVQIGTIIYESRKNNIPVDTDELTDICNDIDKIKNKIKNLEKKIVNIKSNNIQQDSNTIERKEISYATLNKKENDLKILRTDNGIQFLKFCSECQTGNNPDVDKCIKCGHIFK